MALRIPIFESAHEELRDAVQPPWPRWMRELYALEEKQDSGIAASEGVTTIPAALGALASRIRQRLELLASVAGGLEKDGWTLHIEGNALLATRVVTPQLAREQLEASQLSGPLCAIADMDESGWPKLYVGLQSP
ncbi:MAG: hypothetical protein ACYDAC_12455 [Candidatus Dormibacteria bacterium]